MRGGSCERGQQVLSRSILRASRLDENRAHIIQIYSGRYHIPQYFPPLVSAVHMRSLIIWAPSVFRAFAVAAL